ncbi:hypothetical protein niasHT_010268 [Heterodera trifolii]|uniref:Major sperm protein n=1 Tax=Heterodera trifolii TaxID=157864 RepID=A0ABD2M5H5_9BILA
MYDSEDDFGVGVAPKSAFFSSANGGASRHLVVNGSSERMAVKVKCSNNRLFRISPVFTILDPGCAQRLQIVRDPGSPGTDKVILLYTRTTGRNARDAFEQSDKSQHGRLLIALIAHEGEEKPNEAEDNRNKDMQRKRGSAGRSENGQNSRTYRGPTRPTDQRLTQLPMIGQCDTANNKG